MQPTDAIVHCSGESDRIRTATYFLNPEFKMPTRNKVMGTVADGTERAAVAGVGAAHAGGRAR